MQPFKTLTSKFIPLPHTNVDTDQIIPAQFLKCTDKQGLAEGLFQRWRYKKDGSLDPAFALNDPALREAQILLAGDNFGCGSSREHAPWALAGWGFRAVISSSFADIFRSNALKNGLLPVAVDAESLEELFDLSKKAPQASLTIELAAQSLTFPDQKQVSFAIDPFSKMCLIEGVDQLGYLLNQEAEITTYEASKEVFLKMPDPGHSYAEK